MRNKKLKYNTHNISSQNKVKYKMNDRFLNNIKNNITCPLSLQIYRNPVHADDGYTYEEIYLKKWLAKNESSPFTKKRITNYYYDLSKKSLVDIILTEYPHFRKDQYVSCEDIVKEIIKNSDYSDLNFDDFDFEMFGSLMFPHDQLKKFFTNIRSADLYKLIDLYKSTVDNYNNNINNNNLMGINTRGRAIRNTFDGEFNNLPNIGRGRIIRNYDIEVTPDSANSVDSLDYEQRFGDTNMHFGFYRDNRHNSDNKDKVNNINKFLLRLFCHADLEYIKYVISKNINVNVKDCEGRNCIHYACFYSTDDEIIKYIINNYEIDSRSIIIICSFRNPSLAKFVLDKENINLETVYDGSNNKLIHIICKKSVPHIIKYIIDKNVDLEAANCENYRPIHYLCMNRYFDCVKYLVEKGVNINAKTNDGNTPLHYACKYGSHKIINYLIQKGANINILNNKGRCAIHYIFKYQKDEQLLKYIIKETPNLIIYDKNRFDLFYFIKNNRKMLAYFTKIYNERIRI